MSQDLIRSLPPGWSVQGLTAARSDGVNWFRIMPGHSATITVNEQLPTYATLRYQTFSAGAAYTLHVSRNGAELLAEPIAKGEYHSAYVNMILPAGTSAVQFQADCLQGSCLPLSLYFTTAQTVAQHTSPSAQTWGAGALAALLLAGLVLWLRPFGNGPARAADPRLGPPD